MQTMSRTGSSESSGNDFGTGDDLTATSPHPEQTSITSSAMHSSPVGGLSSTTPRLQGDGQQPPFSVDEVTDPRLQMAYHKAVKTGRMTPLVKEELRLAILSRRMAKGAGDISVEFSKPVSHSLTPQEQEKRARRRQQNRDAAQKFRQKRKLEEKSLDEEVEALTKRRRELEAEVTRLASEKEAMFSLLLEHCPHLFSDAESLVLAEVGSGEMAPGSVGSISSPQPTTSSAYPADVTSDWSVESSPQAATNPDQSPNPPVLLSAQVPGLQCPETQSLQNAVGTSLQYTEIQTADVSDMHCTVVPCPQYVQMQSLPDAYFYGREGTPDVLQPSSGSSTENASEVTSISSPVIVEDNPMSAGVAEYDMQPEHVHGPQESHEQPALTALPLTSTALPRSASSLSAAGFCTDGFDAAQPVLTTSTALQECQDPVFSSNLALTRAENTTWEQGQALQTPSSSSHIAQLFGMRLPTPDLVGHSRVRSSPAETSTNVQGTCQGSSVQSTNVSPATSKALQPGSKGEADEFSHLPKVFDPFELLTEDQDPKSSKIEGSGKRTKTDLSKVRVFDTNLRDLNAVVSRSMSFGDLTVALYPHIKIMRSPEADFKDIAAKKTTNVKKPKPKQSLKTSKIDPHRDVFSTDLTSPSPTSRLKELSIILREASDGVTENLAPNQGVPKTDTNITAETEKRQLHTPQILTTTSNCSNPQIASETLILQETSMAPHFMKTTLLSDVLGLQDLFSMQQNFDVEPSEDLSPGLSDLTLCESLVMNPEVPQSAMPTECMPAAPGVFDMKVNAIGSSNFPSNSTLVPDNAPAKGKLIHSLASLGGHSESDQQFDPFTTFPPVLMHGKGDPMISGQSLDKGNGYSMTSPNPNPSSTPFMSPCSSAAGSSSPYSADYQNADEIFGDLPIEVQEWILEDSRLKMEGCRENYQDFSKAVAMSKENTLPASSSPEHQELDLGFQQDATALRFEDPPAPLQSLENQLGNRMSANDPNLLQPSERFSHLEPSGGWSWNQSTVMDVQKAQATLTPSSPDSVFETFGPTKPQVYTVTGSVSPPRPAQAMYSSSPSCGLSPTQSPPTFGPLTTVDMTSSSLSTSESSGIFVQEVGNAPQPVSTSLMTPMDYSCLPASGRPAQSHAMANAVSVMVKGEAKHVPVGMLLPPEKPGDPPRLVVSGAVFSER